MVLDECIMAFKVYDSCKQKDCITLGPVLSDEDRVCIIMPLTEYDEYFGKITMPDKPIDLPEEVHLIKIPSDSFKLKKIKIIDIRKSPSGEGYWDITASFIFAFKLQFYSSDMKLLKIIFGSVPISSEKDDVINDHMNNDNNYCKHSDKNDDNSCNRKDKDFMNASINYIKDFTLFGSKQDNLTVASDVLTFCENSVENAPHTLIEGKAYPIDVKFKKLEKDCYDDAFDNTYESPIIYIYVSIMLFVAVYLLRVVSLQVESKGFCIPENCDNSNLKQKLPCPDDKF